MTSIFGWTATSFSQDYVKCIPPSINKQEFLTDILHGTNLVLEQVEGDSFALKGLWSDILKIEKVLVSHIDKWALKRKQRQGKTSSRQKSKTSCEIQEAPYEPSFSEEGLSTNDLPETDVPDISLVGKNANPVDASTEIISIETESAFGETIILPSRSSWQSSNSFLTTIAEQQVFPENCAAESAGNIDEESVPSGDSEIQYDCGNNIENEVYMDIKLSKRPNGEISDTDSNFPLTLVVAAADKQNILNLTGNSQMLKTNPYETNADFARLRRKKYEDRAPFKYFCTHCSFKTKRKSHFAKHSKLHNKVCKMYSCPDCDFSSIRLSYLNRHILVHDGPTFRCSECPYKTVNANLLLRHKKSVHRGVKKRKPKEAAELPLLLCSKCSYSTTSMKLMQRHKSAHYQFKRDPDKHKHQCDHCPYETGNLCNMFRHISNVHRNERPYVCNVCGLAFKRSDTLLQHRRTHAKTDPEISSFQCEECKNYYRSKPELINHRLTHSDVRSFLCEICGASFKTRAVQRKHTQAVHSQQKEFSCKVCSRKFISRYLVKRHQKVHEVQEASEEVSHLTSSEVDSKEWSVEVLDNDSNSTENEIESTENAVEATESVVQEVPMVLKQEPSYVPPTVNSSAAGIVSLPVWPVHYVLSSDLQSTTQVQGIETPENELITITLV